jgi:hypothetical protein
VALTTAADLVDSMGGLRDVSGHGSCGSPPAEEILRTPPDHGATGMRRGRRSPPPRMKVTSPGCDL